jgi:serine/threonine protein kinase
LLRILQVGTALFVAPEVMHNFNNAPYDGAAVDVWAAGIVLFILLFGRHPFLRPEDSSLPEQQQMLALFTRTAASQFCLLPEEAVAITPACADLLSHVLQTSPTSRCAAVCAVVCAFVCAVTLHSVVLPRCR